MTNNKQQTAVEWLIEKCACADLRPELWEIIKQQAKEMEWDQINDAYLQGFNDNDCNPHEDTFNLYYYKQTFEGGEQ
jgi:hypothetical protein